MPRNSLKVSNNQVKAHVSCARGHLSITSAGVNSPQVWEIQQQQACFRNISRLIPDPKQQGAWLEFSTAPPPAEPHYHFKQVQRYSDNLTAHVMTCFNYPHKEPLAPAHHSFNKGQGMQTHERLRKCAHAKTDNLLLCIYLAPHGCATCWRQQRNHVAYTSWS